MKRGPVTDDAPLIWAAAIARGAIIAGVALLAWGLLG